MLTIPEDVQKELQEMSYKIIESIEVIKSNFSFSYSISPIKPCLNSAFVLNVSFATFIAFSE